MAPNPRAGLQIRKLADKSEEERVTRYDPLTGEQLLLDPATTDLDDPSTWEHSPWPLAGVEIVGDAPKRCRISTSVVSRGLSEGWLEAEGLEPVHRPGGPPEDRWRQTHTFSHYKAIVLKCADGDVRYRVVRQPDKYAGADEGEKPDSAKVTDKLYEAGETHIRWFYDLELEA